MNARREIDKETLQVGKRVIFRGLGCLRILSAQRVPVTVDRCLRLAELEPGSGWRNLDVGETNDTSDQISSRPLLLLQ